MNSRQNGFSAIEAIVSVAIICILILVGGVVWNHRSNTHNKSNTASITNQPTTISSSNSSTNQSTNAAQGASYLAITEWNLKITLSNPINDAYYVVSGYDSTGKVPDQISLSLKSLSTTQCKAGGWPPSIYFRYTAADTDPVSGKLLTQIYGTSHKLGDYYYAYENGYGVDKSGGCQSTPEAQTLANNAAIGFKAAMNTLQPIN
jgi:type II secretory pathway pseudopilin PulG